MTKILLLGDVHGNREWFNYACLRASELECASILQLGDFGYWPGETESYLDSCEEALVEYGLSLVWIDGNHEFHPHLKANYGPGSDNYNKAMTRSDVQLGDFWFMRKHIAHAPRGARWEWDTIRFLACGGAYSVDKKYRIPGKSWWPEEMITGEDVENCGDSPCDVLVSHDVPQIGQMAMLLIDGENVPGTFMNRKLLQSVVHNTIPLLNVHGHYHVRYSETCGDLKIEGFSCDGDYGSMGVLELPSLEVTDVEAY